MTHDVPKPCLSRSWTDRLPCALPQGHSGPHANRITATHRRVEWFDNPSTKTDARVGRHTVDSITSDDLDQLYARIETLEHVAAGNKRHVQLIVPDLERAEAALERVRALAEDIRRGAPWTANHDNIANRINAAIDTAT